MSKEKILKKIRALLAKAKDEAASDNEVLIFMAKAQELMSKYKVTNKDVDLSQDEIVCIFFDSYIKYFDEINLYINTEYLRELASCIAVNNFGRMTYMDDFKIIDNKEYKFAHIRFIGKEEDIINIEEQFRFLYKKFFNLALKRYDEAKKQQVTLNGKPIRILNSYKYVNKQIYIRSYLKGTIKGLWEKYAKVSLENKNNEEYGLIISNYKNALSTWVKENLGELKASSSRKTEINDDAFKKGKKDGKENSNKNYKRLL